jgi:hypothetical protein
MSTTYEEALAERHYERMALEFPAWTCRHGYYCGPDDPSRVPPPAEPPRCGRCVREDEDDREEAE